ncbi:MAG: type 1 glutamine amidotransferase domain-containing protein [Gemmatimonadaceae bacterium]|jgi:putative intracellular protease/amidase|nr:type 1 glutamine amidotransferase domain-containing protein [Gemmatimonadaceae bacterium]
MTPRILFVLTSHGTLGNTGRTTGFYVPEAAHPWRIFTEAGCVVDFVSPEGGAPPMDGVKRDDPAVRAFLDDAHVAAQLQQTLQPADIDPSRYAAIFFVGGHGTMWDLPDDAALAAATSAIDANGGIVAAVCHGPAGLVNVRRPDGTYLVAGHTVSAFTDAEEATVGLTDVVPFLLSSTLAQRGAVLSAADVFQPKVSVSGRLVTGQNPASASGVAEAVVAMLRTPVAA